LWVGLEVNILAIIPIFVSIQNTTSADTTLKYFISQSVASIIFLFSLLNTRHSGLTEPLLQRALVFKLGLPPFHRWLVRVVLERPWRIIFLILFVQKFIPLHILRNVYVSLTLFTAILIVSLAITLFLLKILLPSG
jgi:NADH-ubiquinone oxidoreductase chain 2